MRKKKNVVQKENVIGKKLPKRKESPNSYLSKNPVWAFSRCDFEHTKWSINCCNNMGEDIIKKLKDYERMTWKEILQASGGKRKGNGNNNHFENISELKREAQKRLNELKIYEDKLFSLRLTGKQRMYGILDDGILYVIWFDKEHEIYASNK